MRGWGGRDGVEKEGGGCERTGEREREMYIFIYIFRKEENSKLV